MFTLSWKPLILLGAVAALLFEYPAQQACGFTQAPAAAAKEEESSHTKDSPAKVREMMKEKKAILLDVREQREWDAGHLVGARLLPLSTLREGLAGEEEKVEKFVAALKQRLPQHREEKAEGEEEPKRVPIIIYTHCRSGGRCVIAAEALRKLGYRVEALKPGYADLLEAGFERADPDKE